MNHLPRLITLLILIFGMALAACSHTILYNDAIKKHGTAQYYLEQRDYYRAKKYGREALVLWERLRDSEFNTVSEWSIEHNIEKCKTLLKFLPTPGLLSDETTVSVKVQGNRMFVEARLDQKENVTLLVDTGATSTVISPEVAERLGIGPGTEDPVHTVTVFGGMKIDIPYVKLQRINIGDAYMEKLHVGVYLPSPERPGIDGILGTDFLGSFQVSIDHRNEKLTLKPHDEKPGPQ